MINFKVTLTQAHPVGAPLASPLSVHLPLQSAADLHLAAASTWKQLKSKVMTTKVVTTLKRFIFLTWQAKEE